MRIFATFALGLVVGCAPLFPGWDGSSTDACSNTCVTPTWCGRIEGAFPPSFWFLSPTDVILCTEACTRDADCVAMGDTAYCTIAGRCATSCASDADCAAGVCVEQLACALASDTLLTHPPPTATPNDADPPLAVGATTTRSTRPCVAADRLDASSRDPAVAQVLRVEPVSGACGGVTFRGVGAGSTAIDVSVDGVLRETWPVTVDEAAFVTIASGGFQTSLEHVDLQRATSAAVVFEAVTHSADGTKLESDAVTWSLDDESLARLEPFPGTSFVVIEPTTSGATLLRAHVGHVARAIPIDVVVSP